MPTFVEVCTGAGGLSVGLLKAGFTPLLINELDKICCETLRRNHESCKDKIVQGDMKELLRDEYSYCKNVDLLAGGVPCQSFSQAGKRKGLEDERGNLILVFAQLVEKLKPKVFLIENVEGLKTHDNGNTITKITELLSCNNAYTISMKVLNANDYNVAQKRKRLFIVGVRSDVHTVYEFPKPKTYKPVLRDVLTDVPESEGFSYTEEKKRVLDLVPEGGCWVDLPIEEQKKYMGKSFFSGGGKRGIGRRLSMSEPSLTLTTSPMQKQTERCHPTETRPLTIREYARIQSFSDSYEFCGSKAQQYKQIGNAVPPKLAKAIGKSLMKLFDST